MNAAQIVGIVFGAGMGIVALSALFSVPFWLLWNACMVPAVSVTNEITFLQAWGLCFLLSSVCKSTTTSS